MTSAVVICDGSADNQTGRGGWAAVVRHGRSLVELYGHTSETTSNRMELTAAIEGLRHFVIPTQISLVSDSAYLVNTMRNKWYERWIEESLHRSKPRPNLDLWRQLIGLSHFHDVQYLKVKGHSGDYWNERADWLAEQARRNQLLDSYLIPEFTDLPCSSTSPSGRPCKLHAGHSGHCHWATQRSRIYA